MWDELRLNVSKYSKSTIDTTPEVSLMNRILLNLKLYKYHHKYWIEESEASAPSLPQFTSRQKKFKYKAALGISGQWADLLHICSQPQPPEQCCSSTSVTKQAVRLGHPKTTEMSFILVCLSGLQYSISLCLDGVQDWDPNGQKGHVTYNVAIAQRQIIMKQAWYRSKLKYLNAEKNYWMGTGSCAFKFNVVNEQHYILKSKLLPYAGTFCHFLEI